MSEPDELASAVLAGDRRALARAITLVESSRSDHREQADALLTEILPHTGDAMRVGITGAPGVGKSTFIEALGVHLADGGTKVAVLAVDPSSARSGGSILGDKTRMTDLARHPDAFIRPSPAGTTAGGVARRTRETSLLCEAAGFAVVLIETVGVGQSETAVADMVDQFVLLVGPGGGDDLQGIKRGVVELADLLVVTKADGDLLAAARQTAADYSNAIRLLRPRHRGIDTQVLLCSALSGDGIAAVWDAVVSQHDALVASGAVQRDRARQARAWLWAEVRERVMESLRGDPEVAALIPELEEKVVAGALTPTGAADQLLAAAGISP